MSDLEQAEAESMKGATDAGSFLLTRRTIKEWVGWFFIASIMLSSIVLFFFYVEPSFSGKNNLRIGADSVFYLWHAGLVTDNPYRANGDNLAPSISLSGNLLGPDVIGKLLRSSFLILCFNYVLFFVAVAYIAKAIPVRVVLLTILLLINPAILVSVLTLNKEIIVLLSTAMLCYYIESERRSWLLLCCTLLVALLGRWQNLLVVIFFLLLTAKWNPMKNRRNVAIALVVLAITIAYSFLWPFINVVLGIDEYEGKTIVVLAEAQTHFLYFAVVIPKIALNLYGGVIGLAGVGSTDSDVYNSMIVPLASLANAIVTVWYCIVRKIDLRNDRLYLAILYAVIFAVSPFVQCRYLLPIYLLLCVEIARHTEERERSMRLATH
jgi:hypothetical protein